MVDPSGWLSYRAGFVQKEAVMNILNFNMKFQLSVILDFLCLLAWNHFSLNFILTFYRYKPRAHDPDWATSICTRVTSFRHGPIYFLNDFGANLYSHKPVSKPYRPENFIIDLLMTFSILFLFSYFECAHRRSGPSTFAGKLKCISTQTGSWKRHPPPPPSPPPLQA